MDKILLNGMMFYGYHGLYPEENKLGQRFTVDVELISDLKKPGKTDNMEDSIHYGAAYEVARKVVEGEAQNLVEKVADYIAKAMFDSFSKLEAIRVKVDKPGPPIPGYYQSVAIEIYRERSDYE
ncbi:dihydroneopterin aldolase [Halalkalibacillus sediminis]|uniref:7,8-dihydroneopterin aldolase n=1 Tax=Halalkalibacillus sediminis TaxID=2018042 RepID=A0A2I0QT54_9BACI|nr:dihydroneopterin aldolase [Halalkalibacillus sediminis]PKR77522.1 dihydroneopterin aldolase [Halalkalibacillus sediminis]